MKLSNKKIFVGSQILVVLAFFAGMLLNYYFLQPVINDGETYRMTSDIGLFLYHFCPEEGCDARDKSQVDSVLALYPDPYGEGGDFFLMDHDARIIYAKYGETGNAFEVLKAKYGDFANYVLQYEFDHPGGKESMDYEKYARMSYYAIYRENCDLMMFYAADYQIVGRKLYHAMNILLIIMALGGIMVMMISYHTVRRFDRQARNELSVLQEIETAASIQRSMLPRGEKYLMQLDVNARLVPARKVAGDLFSYLMLDGILYFCIGDVSGKGIPASLFMSKAVTLFRSYADARLSPSAIAGKMNNELCINNDRNMFLTGIVGTVRASDGFIRFVNAGHEPPIVWNGESGSPLRFLECEGNIPFGVIPDTEFVEETYEIAKNGMVLMYTDGISEAKNAAAGLLGRKKLLEILEPFKSLSSKLFNDKIMSLIANYESGLEQSDDITLLTFRNSPNPKRMVLKNSIPELKKISDFTKEVLNECPMDRKQHILVRSGLDEALTNCVLYAYDRADQDIEVTAAIENHKLIFTVKDSGKPFNPLEYRPEVSEELKVGGLGISIYKANFDEVQYAREDGCNILKLIKKL